VLALRLSRSPAFMSPCGASKSRTCNMFAHKVILPCLCCACTQIVMLACCHVSLRGLATPLLQLHFLYCNLLQYSDPSPNCGCCKLSSFSTSAACWSLMLNLLAWTVVCWGALVHTVITLLLYLICPPPQDATHIAVSPSSIFCLQYVLLTASLCRLPTW